MVVRLAFANSSFLGVGAHNRRCSFEGALHSISRRPIITNGVGIRQTIRCARVLVVNCPSGGHAFLGAHLSKLLLSDGHSVRLLHSGESVPAGVAALYGELQDADGDFSVEYGAIPSSLAESYDTVYDNYSKSAEDCALSVQQAGSGAEVHYVSSAGAYKTPASLAPSRIGDAAKGGTIDAEEALTAAGARGASFRPIYIYGPGSAKRAYLDFFFDRLVRGRPLYVPGCGDELTSLTDVRDVAGMLYAALGTGSEGRKVYNAVTPRGVTFDGVAGLAGEVLGTEVRIVHFDAGWAEDNVQGFKLKKYWPFRVKHFFADPSSAVRDLGWTPTHSGTVEGLRAGIAAAFEEYKSLGLHNKQMTFEVDDAIAAAL